MTYGALLFAALLCASVCCTQPANAAIVPAPSTSPLQSYPPGTSGGDQQMQNMLQNAAHLADDKQPAQAEALFRKIVTEYPNSAAPFVAFGDYYASQKLPDKAIREWQAAIMIEPNNPQALLRLGRISLEENESSDAVNYLKHYTAISPDALGFALLGKAFSMQRDYQSARAACGRSFQIKKTPETLGCLGAADYKLQKYQEAANIFSVLDRNAKGFLEQNPQLLYYAAESYQSANECSEAVAAYKRLLPIIKEGSEDYTEVQDAATATCNAQATGTLAAGASNDVEPVVIDDCTPQLDNSGQVILPIIFHATDRTATAVEFVFWVNDTFGNREGAIFAGITSGTFSAGAQIKPVRGGMGNRYYTRDGGAYDPGGHPDNAVWKITPPVGNQGTIVCKVYQVKFEDGTIWIDHSLESPTPILLRS